MIRKIKKNNFRHQSHHFKHNNTGCSKVYRSKERFGSRRVVHHMFQRPESQTVFGPRSNHGLANPHHGIGNRHQGIEEPHRGIGKLDHGDRAFIRHPGHAIPHNFSHGHTLDQRGPSCGFGSNLNTYENNPGPGTTTFSTLEVVVEDDSDVEIVYENSA
ncbi:uncharacterized protein LOC128999621 [Macrosteles quadrilineatus]|uniref:uncharacterized protein LOC128999621 n=1 Tax=Macrosteles quadrilineatus TaxID=74068 RepID=UPI0023E12AB1|nr:uncharacterized protein LOC128999621 [Macrosteles quadrilineatus]